MFEAIFHFHGDLNYFLPPERQDVPFPATVQEDSSIKDTLESLGVPHTEIDVILVNHNAVDFSIQISPNSHVHIYPPGTHFDAPPVIRVGAPPLPEARFVLDTHLGRLASHLRKLGFDTLYRNDYEDEELARISSTESRILLTRDRGLLKRGMVVYGYFVRSTKPKAQVIELLRRYDLVAQLQPFKRCALCNGLLKDVTKESISHRLQPYTQKEYDKFRMCEDCEQIYWQGSHFSHIQAWIEEVQDVT